MGGYSDLNSEDQLCPDTMILDFPVAPGREEHDAPPSRLPLPPRGNVFSITVANLFFSSVYGTMVYLH